MLACPHSPVSLRRATPTLATSLLHPFDNAVGVEPHGAGPERLAFRTVSDVARLDDALLWGFSSRLSACPRPRQGSWAGAAEPERATRVGWRRGGQYWLRRTGQSRCRTLRRAGHGRGRRPVRPQHGRSGGRRLRPTGRIHPLASIPFPPVHSARGRGDSAAGMRGVAGNQHATHDPSRRAWSCDLAESRLAVGCPAGQPSQS